jgi:hypothetical protein
MSAFQTQMPTMLLKCLLNHATPTLTKMSKFGGKIEALQEGARLLSGVT